MGQYFPVFLNMEGQTIQVFGGGNVAYRRTRLLLEFGAKVVVTAPKMLRELEELAEKVPNLMLEYRRYRPSELCSPDFVLAATGEEEVDTMIFRECRHKEILVNVASNQELCDFFFPGIIRKGEITVGVTANGKDHREAARVTREIEQFLKGGNFLENN